MGIAITEDSSSLDSYKHNRNRSCGRWSLKGPGNDIAKGHCRYVKLGCKKWTCPYCGPRKANRLRHAIIEKAMDKNMSRFLTLTLDPSTCRPEDSIPYIRGCWNKFRTYLKRKHGSSISFIAILELQKSGHAHLHILVDRYIKQSWISAEWQAVGGGKIVYIKHVDIHRVAAYLGKYLTKELLLGGFNTRIRRYTTSRDIVLFVKKASGVWSLIKAPLSFLYGHITGSITKEDRDKEGQLQWFEVAEPI